MKTNQPEEPREQIPAVRKDFDLPVSVRRMASDEMPDDGIRYYCDDSTSVIYREDELSFTSPQSDELKQQSGWQYDKLCPTHTYPLYNGRCFHCEPTTATERATPPSEELEQRLKEIQVAAREGRDCDFTGVPPNMAKTSWELGLAERRLLHSNVSKPKNATFMATLSRFDETCPPTPPKASEVDNDAWLLARLVELAPERKNSDILASHNIIRAHFAARQASTAEAEARARENAELEGRKTAALQLDPYIAPEFREIYEHYCADIEAALTPKPEEKS